MRRLVRRNASIIRRTSAMNHTVTRRIGHATNNKWILGLIISMSRRFVARVRLNMRRRSSRRRIAKLRAMIARATSSSRIIERRTAILRRWAIRRLIGDTVVRRWLHRWLLRRRASHGVRRGARSAHTMRKTSMALKRSIVWRRMMRTLIVAIGRITAISRSVIVAITTRSHHMHRRSTTRS